MKEDREELAKEYWDRMRNETRINLLEHPDLPEGVRLDYICETREFVFSVIHNEYGTSVRLPTTMAKRIADEINIWGNR